MLGRRCARFAAPTLSGPFPVLAREVLMRWGSCLGTQSAEVLRAVYDGQHLT